MGTQQCGSAGDGARTGNQSPSIAAQIAGGLTEGECLELIETIKQVNAAGITIVWIEHIVHALVAVVGRLSVLNFGKKVAEGDPQEVMASAEVRQFYIGLLA